MKSKFLLLAAMGMVGLSSTAQRLTPDYITWPDGQKLATDVANWNPGTALFEDENFFISRVKAKPVLKRNVATQIYENINDANDKRLVFWVPVGNTNLNGVHTDALPNGIYDSEVFSLWSYVTHFGDWTSPYGWVPGGFADAAHRHGVAVSGVASIPNASINNTAWGSCLEAMGKIDVQRLAKFLNYHGVNGLGYNSEYSVSSSIQHGVQAMHAALVKEMANIDPLFENVWYDGSTDNGQISFPDCLNNNNKINFGDSENKRTNFFLNYNWNYSNKIASSRSLCNELGRDMRDLYAGMNMQGGNKSDDEWTNLQTLEYSIGLWGAHDFNYLWCQRSKNGASSDIKQRTYQRQQEQWFTNGVRNPAKKVEVYRTKHLAPTDQFFGMSRFLSAKSTLGWNLSDEPFVTYFNLGNGKFFNFKGERQNNAEWYKIGAQDYMPTWRFWFANEFLGKEPANVPESGLDAEFTWEDAYFGGSCLKIFGSTPDEYLHLFRTSFKLERNDVITVRYKLISGKANLNLALSVEGTETKIERETSTFKVFTTEQETDDEQWIEKTFAITGPAVIPFNVNPVAMIALHFTDAENMELLLGEISIKRGKTTTPVAPRIDLTKVLAYNFSGCDAKIIFNMPNNLPKDQVCYNSDVNTSLFAMWAQQKGEEPVMMGVTSSWADILYQIPIDADGEKEVRIGVQALSMDYDSASEITWSNYMALGEYSMSEDVVVNKSTIKPNESFTVSFADPNHEEGEFVITHVDGTEVFRGTGKSVELANGVEKLGSYHVTVKSGDKTATHNYLFLVSAWDKGALPEITKLTVNGDEAMAAGDGVAITPASDILLGYEGREADGASSRGIEIDERFVGVSVADLGEDGIENEQSFGTAAWVNMRYPNATSALFQVENRAGSWPANNWGWCWFDVDANGKLNIRFRGQTKETGYYYNDVYVPNNAWTHVAFSFEYEGLNFRFRLFINGEEKIPYLYGTADGGGGVPTGSEMVPDLWIRNKYPIAASDWLSWGGGRGSEPNYNNGVVDDMVIWKGAITEEDAKKAMAGFDADNLPENVMCFWSFEDEPDGYCFISKGQKAVKAQNFALEATGNEGQALQIATEPIIGAGCPTLEADAFKVVTTPKWTTKRGVQSEAQGTHTSGSVKVNYPKDGDYKATLTLENVLGSHSMEYPVLKAKSQGLVEGITADDYATYTIDDAVIVEFPVEGDYTVAVFDIEGRELAKRSQNVAAGQAMTIGFHHSGVFMVNIMKDGKVIRTVKLLKK